MKLLAVLLAALFFVSCAHSSPHQKPKNYAHVAGKVFAELIDMPGAISGTAFRYRNRIITAGHFCEHWERLEREGAVGSMQIRYAENGSHFAVSGYFVARKWRHETGIDVCVLRPIADTETPEEMEELERATPPAIGDPVSIIGAPLGLSLFRTDGYVASLKEAWAENYMLVSATAFGGNSGSPVLDAEGKLVGMLVAGAPVYPTISVVIPTYRIDAFLDATH